MTIVASENMVLFRAETTDLEVRTCRRLVALAASIAELADILPALRLDAQSRASLCASLLTAAEAVHTAAQSLHAGYLGDEGEEPCSRPGV